MKLHQAGSEGLAFFPICSVTRGGCLDPHQLVIEVLSQDLLGCGPHKFQCFLIVVLHVVGAAVVNKIVKIGVDILGNKVDQLSQGNRLPLSCQEARMSKHLHPVTVVVENKPVDCSRREPQGASLSSEELCRTLL